MMKTFITAGITGILMSLSVTFAIADSKDKELIVYSGRGETFVGPVLKMFEKESGIKVRVRYGSTAEISALLQEEGEKSPADIFWSQDGAALGVNSPLFDKLPDELFKDQPEHFRSDSGLWIGITGRARSFAYSTERVKADTLPQSIAFLTDKAWKGRIGWAPGNASFQSFVTAMRITEGEDKAAKWVEGIKANGAKSYKNNTAIIQAIADGEIDAGIVNTYYLARFKTRDPAFPVAQTFFKDGDIGNLLNVAGVGVLKTSQHKEEAMKLIAYLMSPTIQQYFTSVGSEFPVIKGVIPNETLEAVANPSKASPEVDINKLMDIKATRDLLSKAGLL